MSPPPTEGGVLEDLLPVAEAAPPAAVMEAYSRVEQALREKVAEAELETDLRVGAASLARLAANRHLITPETLRAVLGLSLLRNMAGHGHLDDVTSERAKDYLALTDAVLYAINAPPADGLSELE